MTSSSLRRRLLGSTALWGAVAIGVAMHGGPASAACNVQPNPPGGGLTNQSNVTVICDTAGGTETTTQGDTTNDNVVFTVGGGATLDASPDPSLAMNNNNTVTVNGTINSNSIYTVSLGPLGNTVTVNGGGSIVNGGALGALRLVTGVGDVAGNMITVNAGGTIQGYINAIYLSAFSPGLIRDNVITINQGATVNAGSVGLFFGGDSQNNTVTVNGNLTQTSACGCAAAAVVFSDSATGNAITVGSTGVISSAQGTGIVFGGDATNNTITVNAGGQILGYTNAISFYSAATGNVITINQGATVNAGSVGLYFGSESQNNTITVNGNLTQTAGCGCAAGILFADSATGNTITVGSTGAISSAQGNAIFFGGGANGNAITVNAGGLVRGLTNGVQFYDAATGNTFTINGTIEGTDAGSAGLQFQAAATNNAITVGTGGLVSGVANGVQFGNTTTGNMLTINGTVQGTDAGSTGILFQAAATNNAMTIGTGGLVIGVANGLQFGNAAAGNTLTINGTAQGTGAGSAGLLFQGAATNNAITIGAGGLVSGVGNGVLFANTTTGNTLTINGTVQGTGAGSAGVQSMGTVGNTIAVGTGGLVSGVGQGLRLDGAGTVDGNAIVNGGTITGATGIQFASQAGNANTITNNVGGVITGTGGAAIDAGNHAGSLSLVNRGAINGSIAFGAGNDTLTLFTDQSITGTIQGGSGSNALILDGAGASAFSNTIVGNSFNTLTKQGTGTWTLGASQTFAGGATVNTGTLLIGAGTTLTSNATVNAATLIVDGSLVNSTTTVNAGGTLIVNGLVNSSMTTVNVGGLLAGGGTIAGNTTINGVLSPGNSIGTLTVQGNLVLSATAAYLIEVSPSAADRTNVAGIATLGGAVQASFGPGLYFGRTYTILSANGGLTGTFSALTAAGLPAGFATALSYTSNDVILNLTAVLGQGVALNQNERDVVNTLNAFFNNGGTLPPNFVSVFGLTGGNLAGALTQLSGEAAAGAQHGAFKLMDQFLALMLDPFVDGRASVGGGPAIAFAPDAEPLPDDVALAYSKIMKAPVMKAPAQEVPTFEQRWGAWAAAYGGRNRTGGDAVVGSHDLTARTAGFAAGLDYRATPDSVVGVALGGGGADWSLAQGLGGGKSDAFQAGAYAATRWGGGYLAASLAYAQHWMSTDRVAPFADRLSASFDAQSLGMRAEGGYRFATALGGVTPYAAAQAQSLHLPSYRETDVNRVGFALAYNARTGTDTRIELGARFDRVAAVAPNAVLTLRGRLAWAHDWVSNPALTAAFQALPGASFIVNGAAPVRDSALVSAGAELRLVNGVTLSGKFDGELAQRSSTYAGTGTVRFTW